MLFFGKKHNYKKQMVRIPCVLRNSVVPRPRAHQNVSYREEGVI